MATTATISRDDLQEIVDSVNRIAEDTSSGLSPEDSTLLGSIAVSIVRLKEGRQVLATISDIETIVRKGPIHNPQYITEKLSNTNLTETCKDWVNQYCNNTQCQPADALQEQERLLETIRLEKQSFANEYLTYSAFTSAIALYYQYKAIRVVWDQIKEAKFLVKKSVPIINGLRSELELLNVDALKLRALVNKFNNKIDTTKEIVDEIRELTFDMIPKLAEVRVALGAIELNVKNGIDTLRAAVARQENAVALNLVHAVTNCIQLATVGSAAGMAMKVVYGVVTAGFLGAGALNIHNTFCCNETLESLRLQMASIEGMGKLVKTISGMTKEAKLIYTRE